MTSYAIKIGRKYFDSFIYYEKRGKGRYGGNFGNAGIYQYGDIVDIKLTESIEITMVRRELGEKISLIYDIDKFKNSKINIIPIEDNKSVVDK